MDEIKEQSRVTKFTAHQYVCPYTLMMMSMGEYSGTAIVVVEVGA
jgi:hypothetical protein